MSFSRNEIHMESPLKACKNFIFIIDKGLLKSMLNLTNITK